MPYKHRKDIHDKVNNAAPHAYISNLTIHDIHDKPAAHEKDHLLTTIGVVTPGEPVSLQYPAPTVVYIVEGEVVVEDGSKPGETFTARVGDVVHIDKGTRINWKAEQTVKGLVVSYVPTSVQSLDDIIIKN